MAKKVKEPKSKSTSKAKSSSTAEKDISAFDKAAKSIFSIIDNTYTDKELLTTKDQRFRSILDRELEISKGVSQGSIIDFISSVRINNQTSVNTKGQNNSPNSNELFTQNINDIFGYFQDMYRNRFMEMSDLKFIAKFIPALGEAVKTILDSIVASDNIAENVNRIIELPAGTDDSAKTAIINEIKRNEKELKLLKKLKNTIYKKTLVTGQLYVYAVSYNKIFQEYDAKKKYEAQTSPNLANNQFNRNQIGQKATETFTLGDVDIAPAMESVQSILRTAPTLSGDGKSKLKPAEINDIISRCREEMPTITCEQSTIYSEALDYMDSLESNEFAMEAFVKKMNKQNKEEPLDPSKMMVSADGTKGVNDIKASKFNVAGTFIKYIDAKNIIPIKVFDQVVGYYLIHPKAKKNKNSAGQVTGVNSIGTTLFSAVNVGEQKKHDAIEKIVDSISEGILKNFDNKFATKNSEYKKLIADCIVANGLTDKDYNIQFIPADDIIEFNVNENEEGFGESVLTDSLFPAKALLSMIVCRMLNYINKTGNKTIAHVYKGPIGAMANNQVQRVIRDIQEQNVTFNDLLSPNLVFNKFNRDGNIALPTAKNGTHLVEFETQEGQNIDMTPEYEKELENMAILGTGVPTVIMEYAGSADFAKQLVSANIKFAGRVATLQSDLEEPTTLLYKKICENSNLSDDYKIICAQSLEIKLPRPRVLINGNNGDYVQSIVSTAEAIASVALGQESLQNISNGTKIKEMLMLSIVKKNSPFLDWEEIDDMIAKVRAEFESDPNSKDDQSGGGF